MSELIIITLVSTAVVTPALVGLLWRAGRAEPVPSGPDTWAEIRRLRAARQAELEAAVTALICAQREREDTLLRPSRLRGDRRG